MCVQRIIFLFFIVLGAGYSPVIFAYDFFKKEDDIPQLDTDNTPEHKDLNQLQKYLAEQHEQEEKNYEVLKNPFYSSERIQIYNYTAYNTSALKSKGMNGILDHINANDLSISFGYGMIYRFNSQYKIGYEYLSNFPYDRGQLVRIFWICSF